MPRQENRKLMRNLHAQENLQWICVGDVNEILFSHENQGEVPTHQIYRDHFHDALNFCILNNLGFKGDVFTWKNNNFRAEGYIRKTSR
jgi:hypothetical protein